MSVVEPKLHHLFPSVIYEVQLNLNTKRINDYCFKLKQSFKSVAKSNHGGWQSPPIKNSQLPSLLFE